MKRLLQLVASIFAGTPESPAAPAVRRSDTEPLRDKIAKWHEQAREYDALGRKELARSLRESIQAHERHLALRDVGRKAA